MAQVMGATGSILLQFCFWRTTRDWFNILWWSPELRSNDGFAQRMNNLYCTMSSITGMGVTVPQSAYCLSALYGEQLHDEFLLICTLPCAYGDCLAEIIGVNGRLRFNVCGIGEKNNKSVVRKCCILNLHASSH